MIPLIMPFYRARLYPQGLLSVEQSEIFAPDLVSLFAEILFDALPRNG